MGAECEHQLIYIQAYRDKAFSSLHLISEAAFQRGIQRMERDLCSEPISGVSRYLLLWARKQMLPLDHSPAGDCGPYASS